MQGAPRPPSSVRFFFDFWSHEGCRPCHCKARPRLIRNRWIGDELQRRGVDAIPKIDRRGPVVEQMPLASAAPFAMDFGPRVEELPIRFRSDGRVVDRLPETGPSGAALIFGVGREQGEIASRAEINATGFILVVSVLKGSVKIG